MSRRSKPGAAARRLQRSMAVVSMLVLSVLFAMGGATTLETRIALQEAIGTPSAGSSPGAVGEAASVASPVRLLIAAAPGALSSVLDEEWKGKRSHFEILLRSEQEDGRRCSSPCW
ncbi:MAG TPA: hypothetical protein VMT85_07920 [Thermoanaerobaculia bacterium]|nr:hypothetical protein [Thermoanaerobaculia bacterium]